MFRGVATAVGRSRVPIATVAVTHIISLLIGIAMVQNGSQFALSWRDNLVENAHSSDPASLAYQHGNNLQAALIDFSRNLALGAIPSTVGGLAIVPTYAVGVYRGWVGGIVSVDNNHMSRLSDPDSAWYYVTVVILQLVPYSLAGGAGVNMGLAYLRPRPHYIGGRKRFGIPEEAIKDVARVYVLVVPLFLLASLVEFLT